MKAASIFISIMLMDFFILEYAYSGHFETKNDQCDPHFGICPYIIGHPGLLDVCATTVSISKLNKARQKRVKKFRKSRLRNYRINRIKVQRKEGIFGSKRKDDVGKKKKKKRNMTKNKYKENKGEQIKEKRKYFKHKRTYRHKKDNNKNTNKFRKNINHKKGKGAKNKNKNTKINPKNDHKRAFKCDFDFMVGLNKKLTTHINKLAQIRRVKTWWDRLQAKQAKADGTEDGIPTFDIPFVFLAAATNNGTTCDGRPISSGSVNLSSIYNTLLETTEIANYTNSTDTMWIASADFTSTYSILKDCSETATLACSTDKIEYTRLKLPKPCNGCSYSCCVHLGCFKPKCSATGCTNIEKKFTLNQDMINHIKDYCIPHLEKWIARYRACGACRTYVNCRKGCQDDKDFYHCQARQCKEDHHSILTHNRHTCILPAGASPDDCEFEECLKKGKDGGLDLKGCMCDCYNELAEGSKFSINGPKFPNPTDPEDLDCLGLADFYPLVRTRMEKCRKFGTDPGNFAACRIEARKAFAYIYACKGSKPCDMTITTSARMKAPRRNLVLSELKKNYMIKN